MKAIPNSNKKVSLLFNPPGNKKYFRDYYCSKISKADYYYHPVDLIYLSGTLDKISKVFLIDAIAENKSKETCIEEIKNINPETLIFLSSAPSFEIDINLIYQLKILLPNTKFIGSGDIFRDKGLEILYKNSFIDALLFDFSTDDILTYLNSSCNNEIQNIIYRSGNNIIEGKINHQTGEFRIPLPLWHLFPKANYSMPFAKHKNFASILTDFGCPYSCDFCPIGTINYKLRSINNVIEELQLLKKMGYREIYFRDQTFGVNKKRTHELLNVMISEKYSFSWSCLSRSEILDDDTLVLMKRAGCHTIMLGIESFNTELLRNLNKFTNNDNLTHTLNRIKKKRINTGGFFMLGFPEETEDSIKKTIKLACSIPLDYASFNIASPRYGTVFRINSIAKGFIDEVDTKSESSETLPEWKNMQVDNITLLRLKKQAVRNFYLRPSYIFMQVFKLRTIWEWRMLIKEAFSLLSKN